MLELRSVHSGYGHLRVLKGISLRVEQGQVVSLIGANGAGKSTTLNTICGIVRAREGEILFEGEDIADKPAQEIVARGISQAPEGRKLFSEMTVLENLHMGAYLRRDKEAIGRDLDRVFGLYPRLAERRQQRAGSLSGGEQQMVAIARALMARPRLLLLDEPSLGLAPILVEQIFHTFEEIKREGVTLFLVEQNAHMALRISDHAYVMATGEINLDGPGRDLLDNDDVRRTYLGEM